MAPRLRHGAGALAVLLLAGCRATPLTEGAERTERTEAGAQGVPRIVAMAPAAAETLAALGLTGLVVGVGDFVTFPPALAARPRVGAYDAPNVERLLALGTTHFVTSASEAAAASRGRLAALGIEVIELDGATWEGALTGMAALGARFGRAEEGAALAAGIRARIDRLRTETAGLPRRTVLCAVGRDPLYAAGPGSHLDALIAAAGGENLLADGRGTYLLASLEAVLERGPEVIVDGSDNRPGAARGPLPGAWGRWPLLPAVAAGRVYQVDPGRYAVPGPRLAEMAEAFARFVHPERFGPPVDFDFAPPGED
ncbi:MAG: helical backbone metal receptor [Thermoanaerobaculia bacterium]|nr:helical backbone metal receptor [Thermoanaerobaculia bacterium]